MRHSEIRQDSCQRGLAVLYRVGPALASRNMAKKNMASGAIKKEILIVEQIKSRIEYLDGHRGLAILLVVFFHAYARWPELVPYGNDYGNFPLFKYGWLGVELFFLISGFVILMTLEKCSTAKEFLYRRWLRLFPAMLICSTLVFLTSSYFFERPAGIPNWENLLPGLTFVEPGWWGRIIGHPVNGIEASFWSLYVEFKFYVFAAVIYYWRGRNTLIRVLILVFLLATFLNVAEKYLGINNLRFVDAIFSNLSFRYFGWFASGAAFYVFSQNKSPQWFAIAFFAAIASAVAEGGFDWQIGFAGSVISIFFAVSIISDHIKKFLSNRLVLFFGAISYPLYLIHENAMVSMIIKLGHNGKDIPMLLLPLPAIITLSAIAFLIIRYCEPIVKSILVRATTKKKSPLKVANRIR